jgi:hypothetical protein
MAMTSPCSFEERVRNVEDRLCKREDGDLELEDERRSLAVRRRNVA